MQVDSHIASDGPRKPNAFEAYAGWLSKNDFDLPKNVVDLALDYISRGWSPVPIPLGRKGPNKEDWPNLTITDANVRQHFNGAAMNIGVQMGPKSGDLCDVDLDSPEAIRMAPYFLPATGAVFGRQSKRRSHYLYKAPDAEPVNVVKFLGDKGKKDTIIELRLGREKGVQTMFPGSKHPDAFEIVEWDSDGEPAVVKFVNLKDAVRMIALTSVLLRHWPEEGTRHELALTVGGFLVRAGLTDDQIDEVVRAVTTEAGDEEIEDRCRAATASAKAFKSGEKSYGIPKLREAIGASAVTVLTRILEVSSDERPLITIRADNLPEIATQAEDVLIAAGTSVYQRGGALVRPIIEEVDASEARLTKVVRFVRINEPYLRDVMGIEARWCKFKVSGDEVPTNAPYEAARTILAREGHWKFPAVSGVISTPTLRLDGTILSVEGYDPMTRLLLLAPPPMKPIPDVPTRDDALAALSILKELLIEFPLVDAVSRAVALSALMTPVVRGAFPVTPMHNARAPTAGTGKSFLFDCVAAISIGQPMPVMAAGRTEEETEKRLGAAMVTGQPLICIDNVNGELKGDALCQLIERPIVEVRILGKTERVRIEARGVSMFSTGNNIILVGDLCRRVITAILDAQLERPELREFSGNPVAKILADRGKYIAAALTICRAYIVAGRPDKKVQLASFGGWSDTVRSALMWLGEADPVDSIEASRGEDPELVDLNEMLHAWTEVLGVGRRYRFTLAEVIKIASEETLTFQTCWPRLKGAIQSVAAGPRGMADAKKLGFWMRSKRGRIASGRRFANDAAAKGMRTYWWIEATGASVDDGPGLWVGATPEEREGDPE